MAMRKPITVECERWPELRYPGYGGWKLFRSDKTEFTIPMPTLRRLFKSLRPNELRSVEFETLGRRRYHYILIPSGLKKADRESLMDSLADFLK